MSNWLKWRLIALFGALTLGGGATYLHAQSDYPAPAATPEAAGERFAQVLALGTEEGVVAYPPFGGLRRGGFEPSFGGVVSRRNEAALGYGLSNLMQILAMQSRMRAVTSRTVSNDGQSAVVEVAPSADPKPLSLVVVAEDGGWRVDAIATYAKSNGLQGEALSESLYSLTGYVPRGYPMSSNMARSRCQGNMKQIMLGIKQYSQDYDEKLPRAREWTDILQPYLKSRQLFTCPALPVGKVGGYAFNQNLSQFNEARIESMATLVSVYETSNLNSNVFGPGTGRAYRHVGGANFAFADGHVKWLARGGDKTLSFNPEESAPSPQAFAPLVP